MLLIEKILNKSHSDNILAEMTSNANSSFDNGVRMSPARGIFASRGELSEKKLLTKLEELENENTQLSQKVTEITQEKENLKSKVDELYQEIERKGQEIKQLVNARDTTLEKVYSQEILFLYLILAKCSRIF